MITHIENEAIAKYMEIPPCDRCDTISCRQYKFGAGIFFDPEDMQYRTSWEWLMPVIEKISKHKYEDGDTAYPRTFGMPFEENPTKVMVRFNRCHLHYGDTLLEAAYNAVIDFIKEIS